MPAQTQEASRVEEIMRFVFLVLLVDSMGVGLILPVLPELIEELTLFKLSGAAKIAGFLLFSFSIAQFIASPVIGNLSDRFGRRPILLFSMLGLSLDYCVMYMASSIEMLFIARVVSGMLAATIPAASACIVDSSTRQDRAKLFGIAGAAIGLGYIIGPVIGGIAGDIDPRMPFAMASALCFAVMFYGWFKLPETLERQNRRSFELRRANPIGALVTIAKDPVIATIAASVFIVQLAGHSIGSVWPFFVAEVVDWGPMSIGLSAGLYGLMIVLVQGILTGPAVKRFGEVKTIFFSLAVGFLTYLGISISATPTTIYLWVVFAGFSQFAFPAMQAIMTANISDDEQGELQGALASLFSLSLIVGPVAMTQLFWFFTAGSNIYAPGAPFVFSAILMLLAICIFFMASKLLARIEWGQKTSPTRT